MASRDTNNNRSPKSSKKGRRIHWGAVFHRTYLRQLGGACGLPDDNGVCEWPIGLSNYTVVYLPETKEIVAENVHSGVVCPINEENGMTVISEFDSWKAICAQLPCSKREKSLSLERSSLDGSGRPLYKLKPGEVYMGTIDEVVGAREREKEEAMQKRRERLEQLLSATNGLTARDEEELEALSDLYDPYDWRLDTKQRKEVFQHTLHVLPRDYPNLNAFASSLTEEAAEILQSRNESNSGCRCGLIVREEIAGVDIDVLRGECQIRGLATTGGRKALIDRLVSDSLKKIGCTHRDFTAPYQRTAETLDKEACLEAARERNTFVQALKKRDRQRWKDVLTRHCLPGEEENTDPTKPVYLSLPDFPEEYPLLVDRDSASDAESDSAAPVAPDTNPLCALVAESDPRLLEAHLKAVVYQKALEADEEANAGGDADATPGTTGNSTPSNPVPPASSGPLAMVESIPCPCFVNQVGCHHGTCACDEEACGNRSFFDFTAAVHDDSPIELFRQIIRILYVNFGGKIHFFNPSLVLYAKNTVLKYTAQDAEFDSSMEDAASTTSSTGSMCEGDTKPSETAPMDANDTTSPVTPTPTAPGASQPFSSDGEEDKSPVVAESEGDPEGLTPDANNGNGNENGNHGDSPSSGTPNKAGMSLIDLLADLCKKSTELEDEDSFDFSTVDTSSLPPYVTPDDLLASRLVLSKYTGPEARYSIFHPDNLLSVADAKKKKEAKGKGGKDEDEGLFNGLNMTLHHVNEEVDADQYNASSSGDDRKRKRNDKRNSPKHRKR